MSKFKEEQLAWYRDQIAQHEAFVVGAENCMRFLRNMLDREQAENVTLRERLAAVEDDNRRTRERNARLIQRSYVLEEYVLDCTCREEPIPPVDRSESSGEDSQVTDVELPVEVIDLTEDSE